MPTLTPAQNKQTNILTVAAELFMERGYDAVSLDDILERVGGSKTTLYSYYGGKEGLFAAMVARECDLKLAHLREQDVKDLDPKAGLHSIGERLLELVSNPVGRAMYRMMVAEAQRFPDVAAVFYKAGPAAMANILCGTIQHWQKKGLLRGGNPEMLALQFTGIILGNFSVKTLLLPSIQYSGKQMKDWLSASVTLFLQGAQTDAIKTKHLVGSTFPHKKAPPTASKAIGSAGVS
jgi:AcrR family transcriptional regulator